MIVRIKPNLRKTSLTGIESVDAPTVFAILGLRCRAKVIQYVCSLDISCIYYLHIIIYL